MFCFVLKLTLSYLVFCACARVCVCAMPLCWEYVFPSKLLILNVLFFFEDCLVFCSVLSAHVCGVCVCAMHVCIVLEYLEVICAFV